MLSSNTRQRVSRRRQSTSLDFGCPSADPERRAIYSRNWRDVGFTQLHRRLTRSRRITQIRSAHLSAHWSGSSKWRCSADRCLLPTGRISYGVLRAYVVGFFSHFGDPLRCTKGTPAPQERTEELERCGSVEAGAHNCYWTKPLRGMQQV